LLLATPAYYLLQAQGVLVLGRWLGCVTRWRGGQVSIGVLLTLAICGASAGSLINLYLDDAYFRDDYRGIVEYIRGTSRPGDAILINAPSQIETVDYYYKGDLPEYPLPQQRPMDVASTQAALEDMVARHYSAMAFASRVYAILWATDESDPERFVETWLDGHCFKALDRWFGNVRLVVYSVPRSGAGEMAQPVDYMLGERIRLYGYTLLTPEPRSGEILQLTLYWEALGPIQDRYKVFTHVVDSRGHIVGQRDSEPGGGARMTTGWQLGELIADNYGLLIQPGTPPGEHVLRVGMYSLSDGRRLPVTEASQGVGDSIELTRLTIGLPRLPPPVGALDIQHKSDARWGSLRLIGYSLHKLGAEHETRLSLRPGDVARLILFWRKEGKATAGDRFVISLINRAGHRVWQQPLQVTGGVFPLSAWRDGEVVRDLHWLHLPPDVRAGAYRLTLRSDGWGGDKGRSLGKVTVGR